MVNLTLKITSGSEIFKAFSENMKLNPNIMLAVDNTITASIIHKNFSLAINFKKILDKKFKVC